MDDFIFNNEAVIRLPGLLLMPFQGRVDDYAINRRSWDTHDKS